MPPPRRLRLSVGRGMSEGMDAATAAGAAAGSGAATAAGGCAAGSAGCSEHGGPPPAAIEQSAQLPKDI